MTAVNGRARSLETAPVWRRILVETMGFRLRIGLLMVLDLVSTPLVLLSPVPLKIAVDSVIGSHPLPGFIDPVVPSFAKSSNTRLLVVAVVLEVVVILLTQLHGIIGYILRTQTAQRLTLRFRAKLFGHIQRLSVAYHDLAGTSDSVYRVQYDAPSIQYLTVESAIPLVAAAVLLVSMVVVIARIQWELAAIAMGVSPFLFLSARLYGSRMRSRYGVARGLESEAMGIVQEALSAVRVVKAFGREEREQERFVLRSGESMRARIRLAIAEGIFGLVVNLTTGLGTAAVLFVGVRSVQSGAMTLGELLMVIAYLTQLYAPLQTISRQAASLQDSLAGAGRAFEVLDLEPDVVDRPDGRRLDRSAGHIEFRDVTFSYDGEHPVLHEISFDVPSGVRLAIAGRTGAGKTTLASLMMRFYDPAEGSVLLDGVDLRDYRLADVRQQFALLPQDPVLFSTTVAENIAYARPEAAFDELVAAARAADAHDFVEALPDGYDTLVGERGMRLSGGERQRIALARAFLKDAPILILDEPTSALDVKTEETIMAAMERLMEGRTVLMIAHRLSTLQNCDLRIDLEHGRLTPDTRRRSRVRKAG